LSSQSPRALRNPVCRIFAIRRTHMCYSAQIEADYRKYVARYGADIDLARSCRSRCAALVFLRLVATPVE